MNNITAETNPLKKSNPVPMTAIILAGGNSSRMKVDKAMLPVSGVTLIEKVALNLKLYFDEIIISTQSKGVYDFLPYRVVTDKRPGQGPMMGIVCGLEASSNAVNFTIACDIPEINIDFLAQMAVYTKEHEIVVPVTEDEKFEPLFAFYNKSLVDRINGLLDRNIRQIFQFYPLATIKTVSIKNNSWLYNLNTTEDYHRYLEGKKQRKKTKKWSIPFKNQT